MNIEYEVTIDDDLDAQQTLRELRLGQPFVKWILRIFLTCLYLISFYCIFWGITHLEDPDSIYTAVLGIFNLLGCILIPFIINPKFLQSSWNRRATERAGKKYYSQKNKQNINITKSELVFTTDISEEAWKWTAFKSLYEGTNSIILSFYSMHNRFISKRMFAEEELQQFKNIIHNHISERDKTNCDSRDGYQITTKDLIEARQLEAIKLDSFKFDLFVCVFLLLSVIVLIPKIESLEFLVLGYHQQAILNRLESSEYWFSILLYSLLFLLYFGKLFPKLNPIVHWNTKKDLRQNFVRRESKQISIAKEGIAIASPSYRKYYQWQGITKAAENNKIFLLYHSRNKEYTIVPKRIFKTEAELINFRQLLNDRETQIVTEAKSI